MKNKEKILIALASFSFFLIVYLVIASKEVKVPNEKVLKEELVIEKVDLVALKNNYQKAVKIVYNSLENNITDSLSPSDASLDPQKYLLETKNKLMGLVVPEEYKIFHLSLIMLIDGVINNNFVLDDNFQSELNKIGEKNPWLK